MRIVASYQEVENKRNLGSLKLALPFYDSEIIFIVGESNNTFCPSNKLIVWSDKSYSIISSILFKEEIIDILYDIYSFFVVLKNKILLFNILNFQYVCTLEDFNTLNKGKGYVLSSNDSLNFIHSSKIIPNHLKINKFKLDSYSQIYSRFQTNLVIKDFKKIQFIETDFFGEYIAVVNESGTKIRIYSSENYACIYKFCRGNSETLIKSLNFDNRNRYLAVVSNRKTIHFFKLYKKKDNSSSFISENNSSRSFVKSNYKKSFLFCTIDGESEDEDEKSTMQNLMYNLKKAFGNQYKPSFAQYKLKNLICESTIYFFNQFREFVCLDTLGEVLFIKFNKKGECYLSRTDRCSISASGVIDHHINIFMEN